MSRGYTGAWCTLSRMSDKKKALHVKLAIHVAEDVSAIVAESMVFDLVDEMHHKGIEGHTDTGVDVIHIEVCEPGETAQDRLWEARFAYEQEVQRILRSMPDEELEKLADGITEEEAAAERVARHANYPLFLRSHARDELNFKWHLARARAMMGSVWFHAFQRTVSPL